MMKPETSIRNIVISIGGCLLAGMVFFTIASGVLLYLFFGRVLFYEEVSIELPSKQDYVYYRRIAIHPFQPEYARTLSKGNQQAHPLVTGDGKCGDVSLYWIDEGGGYLRLKDKCGEYLYNIDADIVYVLASGPGDGKVYAARLLNDEVRIFKGHAIPNDGSAIKSTILINGAVPDLVDNIVIDYTGVYFGCIKNSGSRPIFEPAIVQPDRELLAPD